MAEVVVAEEAPVHPFVGFMLDAECCCLTFSDMCCTPTMDPSLKEKGFCCTLFSGANYLNRPTIFCAGRQALCGYPKFAVHGSPKVMHFDFATARVCAAYFCGLALLACQPGCFGISTGGSLLFLAIENECCSPTQDEKMTEQGRCCTLCISKLSCKKIDSCVDCKVHACCLELSCALPCKNEVPCAFGALGILCCYRWKCKMGCCPKPIEIDAALLGEMQQTSSEVGAPAPSTMDRSVV